jgi:hypothetical protein
MIEPGEREKPTMAEFMLILHSVPANYMKLSPTDIQGVLEKYNAWREKLAAEGKLVHGRKLKDEGGKILAKAGDRLAVTDGPYSETKEVVGGFFLIKAADYNEAVEYAKTCPHAQFGRTEIREIDFMGQPES